MVHERQMYQRLEEGRFLEDRLLGHDIRVSRVVR